MSTQADFFLRYVVPTMYLDHHSPEVEHLRTLAMEQNAKAVTYTWAACMASNLYTKNDGSDETWAIELGASWRPAWANV